MGAGIARQIADKYPQAVEADKKNTLMGNYNKLGNFSSAIAMNIMSPQQKLYTIVNAYTQFGVNSTGGDNFEYAAFELILKKLSFEYGGVRYGFPLIGCGIAGGNKTRILKLIQDFSVDIESKGGSVTVVEFEQAI
jgi:hypothetical protein